MKILPIAMLALSSMAFAQGPSKPPVPLKHPIPQAKTPDAPAQVTPTPQAAESAPVEVRIPDADQAIVDSAWKDVEIAQLRLQIRIQSILARDTTMSYNTQTKKFYKPAPKKAEEPAKKP